MSGVVAAFALLTSADVTTVVVFAASRVVVGGTTIEASATRGGSVA